MEKVMESRGISNAEKSMNPVNQHSVIQYSIVCGYNWPNDLSFRCL